MEKAIGQQKRYTPLSPVTDADRAAIGKCAAENGNLAAQRHSSFACMYITHCFDTFAIAKLNIAKHQNMQYFVLAKFTAFRYAQRHIRLLFYTTAKNQSICVSDTSEKVAVTPSNMLAPYSPLGGLLVLHCGMHTCTCNTRFEFTCLSG